MLFSRRGMGERKRRSWCGGWVEGEGVIVVVIVILFSGDKDNYDYYLICGPCGGAVVVACERGDLRVAHVWGDGGEMGRRRGGENGGKRGRSGGERGERRSGGE